MAALVLLQHLRVYSVDPAILLRHQCIHGEQSGFSVWGDVSSCAEAATGTAQYLDVPLRASFVTAADTTNGMRASFGKSCIAEQGAYYMVRAYAGCP